MDDNTPIANFLNSFVDEGKTRQDQATAVTKIFIDQWIITLGDCKKFTAEDLKEWKVPAMVVKGLDEQGFLKPSTDSDFIPYTSWKSKISDVFPNGLPYKKPMPLLYSSGLQWNYQLDQSLHETLQTELLRHYQHHKNGERDKNYIPIYLFISGPGIGKSRNAMEFHHTMVECASKDSELRSRLENAWVFNISYENGNSLRISEQDTYLAVGTRMFLQLSSGEKTLDHIIGNYEPPPPWDVLALIAKYEDKKLEDATVILVIDGLHNTMSDRNDGLNKNSSFYKTLTNIGDLSLWKTFVISCCTATTAGPIENFIAESSRKHVFLPVSSLKPPTVTHGGIAKDVFDISNPIIRLLVSDCGGHGRALEVLQDLLLQDDINNFNISDLMGSLRNTLENLYKKAFSYTSDEAKQIVQAVLTCKLLDLYQPIEIKSTLTPDKVTCTGMFRFEKVGNSNYGFLTMPYVWLWIMVGQFTDRDDPQLQHWQFNDYKEHLSKNDKSLAIGYYSWQNFEHFNASFRCLKSRMLNEGEITSISEIYHGANLNGNIRFKNHHLQLDTASQQVDTRSTRSNSGQWYVECEHDTVDVRECTHYIINGVSAPYGDAFLGLDTPGGANEIHQYKFLNINSTFTQKNYNDERKKLASKDDYFILITTKDNLNFELPHNSGIVYKQNWDTYFGPFAGRAFIFAVEGPPNINTVGRAQLELVSQVGKIRAEQIITKRPFHNIQDAMNKTDIPEKILKRFKYK
ncbi:11632_t:CDS:2 [Paraglomus brasilianum]|uniref:11632_t:CDS:1 n=1 Tax=Paraglomus brasilianum TaxID=144538 RepID=A0A9N9D6L9_9GLOM|nr:11632_t:CDS:2 [Paraglomus brasilianum]